VSAPKVGVLFAMDQADTALMVAGLNESNIFRMELRAARAAMAGLIKALQIAVRQNSHDMLMTGDELRICESALAKAAGEQS
jgi:hypothetical protein